jgi:hypothetical protein
MVTLVYYFGILSGFIEVLFYILGILYFIKYLKKNNE